MKQTYQVEASQVDDTAIEQVELEEEKPETEVRSDVPIFTEKETWEKVDGLTEPRSTIFFYLTSDPTTGGPLRRGAAVIELSSNYPGWGENMYNLYFDYVEGMQSVGRRYKLFSFDNSKQVAAWIKERQYNPDRRY